MIIRSVDRFIGQQNDFISRAIKTIANHMHININNSIIHRNRI